MDKLGDLKGHILSINETEFKLKNEYTILDLILQFCRRKANQLPKNF